MKILSYNIQYGLGQDGRYDLARIVDAFEDADLVTLQEVDRYWHRSGEVDEPAEIAARSKLPYWVFRANMDMHAGTASEPNRRRQFGNMILSRTPILSARNFPLPKYATVDQHSVQQGLLEAVIRSQKGGPLRVYTTHLSHLCPETRLPQIEMIMGILEQAPREGGSWCGGHPDPDAGWTEGEMPPMPRELVLTGDFNMAPESLEYAGIVGPSTERYGRLINPAGLIDGWVAAGHDERTGQTHQGGTRIDHIFLSASLRDRVTAAGIAADARGSDHLPVWIELDL
jgi:endonuclease/exonuclease/phosphatase family metal-dependent hydrolase